MTATNQDATIVSGDTIDLEFTVTDPDDNPVDLSTSSLEYALAERDGATVVTKTTGGGGVTVGGTDDNVVTVRLAPSDTADIAGVYEHELEETDGSGAVATLATGVVHIRADIIE